jgi:hypothetical protein
MVGELIYITLGLGQLLVMGRDFALAQGMVVMLVITATR